MCEVEFAEILAEHGGLIGKVLGRWRSFPAGLTRADLQQAALIGLWEAHVTWDLSRGASFGTHATWLIRKWVDRRVQEDRRRRRQEALGGLDVADPHESVLDVLSRQDIITRLMRLNRCLSGLQRKLVRLRYGQCFSWAEVGKSLGVSRVTAQAWHESILERLREKLAGKEESYV